MSMSLAEAKTLRIVTGETVLEMMRRKKVRSFHESLTFPFPC
jgi:hypothetical protein